jgi:hypothetical protein
VSRHSHQWLCVVVSWVIGLGEAIVSSTNEWRGNLDLAKFLVK